MEYATNSWANKCIKFVLNSRHHTHNTWSLAHLRFNETTERLTLVLSNVTVTFKLSKHHNESKTILTCFHGNRSSPRWSLQLHSVGEDPYSMKTPSNMASSPPIQPVSDKPTDLTKLFRFHNKRQKKCFTLKPQHSYLKVCLRLYP